MVLVHGDMAQSGTATDSKSVEPRFAVCGFKSRYLLFSRFISNTGRTAFVCQSVGMTGFVCCFCLLVIIYVFRW